MRDCRPLALNSPMWALEDPTKGAELKGVLTSEASAFWRHTTSAAMKPPGVSVMPLNWMDVGGPVLSWLGSAFARLPLTTAGVGPMAVGSAGAGEDARISR